MHQPTPASNLLNPNVLGYDRFEGPFIGQLQSYTNWAKYTNGAASTVTAYATTENVNNSAAWIRSQNANPFFLWLAFNSPHEPLHLPPAGLHTYTTLTGTAPHINANPKLYFIAMIQALDKEIGRLFDSLQMMNKLDSTNFIFIGDNGNTKKTAQIANVDRAKATVYQYGVHVPFIISGPAVINPGRISSTLVNTTDIFATVLELFGYNTWQSQIPANKPVDSKSILPILKNQANQIRPWAFCEMFKVTGDSADGKAMRNADYKLIKFNYGKEEFYNLTNDPAELTNLLNSTLTATDISNYHYLCNEMTTLVGTGTFCIDVGIKENNLTDKLSLFPNPILNILTVRTLVKGKIIIYDELGKKVKEVLITNDETKINCEELQKGFYLVKLISADGEMVSTKKFVKE